MGVRPTVPSHPQPTITASNCSLRYCDRHALFLDTETLDDTVFISDHVDRTYEHFIQVIPTIYRSRRGLTVKTYKYSATSAEHTDSDTFPSAKFTFQISPMAIVMTEKCEWGGDGWHEPSLLLPSPLLPFCRSASCAALVPQRLTSCCVRVVSHAATPLYEFLTRLCAIVGGLFTVFSMFNAVADGAIKTFKSSIGKSS